MLGESLGNYLAPFSRACVVVEDFSCFVECLSGASLVAWKPQQNDTLSEVRSGNDRKSICDLATMRRLSYSVHMARYIERMTVANSHHKERRALISPSNGQTLTGT